MKKLVVMKKSSKLKAAQGWLWAEYNADGSVSVSLTNKGEACISCHSINSRDYNRVFDLFP
ncbi:MAG: cytochrome P460 family protein [Bacteroidota bacterium]